MHGQMTGGCLWMAQEDTGPPVKTVAGAAWQRSECVTANEDRAEEGKE